MLTATSPVFGPATLTLDEWCAALAGSPVAGVSSALYGLCTAAGVDPAVALGQFDAESAYGTLGVAATTHSWGNQTWAGWETQFGATAFAPGNGYTYALYPDWTSGFRAYLYLLAQYAGWGWAPSLQTFAAYWLSGAPAITARVTTYVGNIIAAVQSALAAASYLPAFQSEVDDRPENTCTRRSVGMLLDWMTHGQNTGTDLPAPPSAEGDTISHLAAFEQAAHGIDIGCLYANPPTIAQLEAVNGGMVIQGLYAAVPSPYNAPDPAYQGGHAVFAVHGPDGFLVFDPLVAPDPAYRGAIWPDAVVASFATALSGNGTVLCAVPPQEDPMVTLQPGTSGWFDAPIGAQIYQLDGVTPLTKLSYYPPSTGLWSPGATSATQRAVIIDHNGAVDMMAIMNDADLTARSTPAPTPTPLTPTTITDLLPKPIAQLIRDAFAGAVAGITTVNLAPYLPVSGAHFTLTQAETLAVVLASALFTGVAGRVASDLPAVFAWMATVTQPKKQ